MFFLFAVPAIVSTLIETAAVVIVARVVNDAYDKATKNDDSDE